MKAMKIAAGGTILLAARVESANETGADDCAISRGSRASVIDLAMFVVQRPDPRPRKTPRELHAPPYLCAYAIDRWIRKMPLYGAHANMANCNADSHARPDTSPVSSNIGGLGQMG